MKKFVTILLSITMVLLLTACTTNDTSSNTSTTPNLLCANCNASISNDDNFCSDCGAAVNGAQIDGKDNSSDNATSTENSTTNKENSESTSSTNTAPNKAEEQNNEAEAENYNHPGLMIVDISKDSDLYGKAQNGDFITQVNGIDITDDKILLDIIKERKPGDKISLTIISTDETQKTIEVKLIANTDNSLAKLGISYSVIESVAAQISHNGFDFPFGE